MPKVLRYARRARPTISQILSHQKGLNAGDKVVVEGIERIQPNQKLAIQHGKPLRLQIR